jgi:acyl carrier protein
MDEAQIRDGVIAAIQAVAPEVEPDALRADRPLREQVDLDSMDWLNVIVGFHERFGVDIPESDYARLGTLEAIVAYLRERLPR